MSACTARPHRHGLLIAALLLLGLLSLPVGAQDEAAKAKRFSVLEASTRLVDEVYLLDARIAFDFSADAIEALDNGVPLVVELQIEVYEPRELLWDSSVATLYRRHRIEYRALADRYVVTNLNTGEVSNHTNLPAALAQLGRVHDFPMLDRRLLRVGVSYRARLRARLDVEALPLPLRPVAYLSSTWDLTSAWHDWLLTH
jgi:hypothetical protein